MSACIFSRFPRCAALRTAGFGDAVTFDHRASIIRFAAAHRLPAIYTYPGEAQDGGLASYGPNLRAHYRRAAAYVDKILRGANPAELPVEQPMKFELAINLKTAQKLGLTIPPMLLFQADEVIR
jgi:putative ABC transport system substrate-binding protein